MFKYPYIFNDKKWTFFIDGKKVEVLENNPELSDIVKYIYSKDDKTEDIINKLSNLDVYDKKNNIFIHNFGNFQFSGIGEEINVVYKDLKLPKCLADKVIALYKDGCADYSHFDKFIENIFKNPNEESIKSLYSFLEKCNLPITRDGNFIAYKGVRDDYYSVHGNKDSRILSGKLSADYHILNEPGEYIEMVASDVDKCRESACSTGLHVGSFDYANSFGERVVAVLVNPKDVVAVPYDSSEKCRVSSYTVICDIDLEIKDPDIEVKDNGLISVEKDENLKPEEVKKRSFNYLSSEFREAIERNIKNHSILFDINNDVQVFCTDSDYVQKNKSYNFIHEATTLGQLVGSVGRPYGGISYANMYSYLIALNYKLTVNNKALGKTIVQI